MSKIELDNLRITSDYKIDFNFEDYFTQSSFYWEDNQAMNMLWKQEEEARTLTEILGF